MIQVEGLSRFFERHIVSYAQVSHGLKRLQCKLISSPSISRGQYFPILSQHNPSRFGCGKSLFSSFRYLHPLVFCKGSKKVQHEPGSVGIIDSDKIYSTFH